MTMKETLPTRRSSDAPDSVRVLKPRRAAPADAVGRPVEAHVKIDTGMARLGIRMGDLETFAEKAASCSDLVHITGLMTHLACADAEGAGTSGAVTVDQLGRFEEATARLSRV